MSVKTRKERLEDAFVKLRRLGTPLAPISVVLSLQECVDKKILLSIKVHCTSSRWYSTS